MVRHECTNFLLLYRCRAAGRGPRALYQSVTQCSYPPLETLTCEENCISSLAASKLELINYSIRIVSAFKRILRNKDRTSTDIINMNNHYKINVIPKIP